MQWNYLSDASLRQFVDAALTEDVGEPPDGGDHSSLAAVPAHAQNRARLLIKDEGILAGMTLADMIFRRVDPALQIEVRLPDGSPVHPGDVGLTVSGRAQSILKAERLVLNCAQRMSGIATQTHRLNQLIADTGAKLLDTRKTTPNFRRLEKWAVAIGGGINHRFGLFDMIILKDNHVDYAGGVRQAIQSTREYLRREGRDLAIVVETRTLDEVREALATGGIFRIMLDNMAPALLKEAVQLIDGRYPTEASGGITEATIREVARCGVDYISVGALTHSVKSLDISLKAY
ncbi:MAG: carboxylating nicotinate-nucleotide diphosphorylase [Ferruginibacter sp.]|nr:carboxylating nicotinate-nucleotide diphosphorylase [Cytophagales bacterium]